MTAPMTAEEKEKMKKELPPLLANVTKEELCNFQYRIEFLDPDKEDPTKANLTSTKKLKDDEVAESARVAYSYVDPQTKEEVDLTKLLIDQIRKLAQNVGAKRVTSQKKFWCRAAIPLVQSAGTAYDMANVNSLALNKDKNKKMKM